MICTCVNNDGDGIKLRAQRRPNAQMRATVRIRADDKIERRGFREDFCEDDGERESGSSSPV